LLFFLSLKTLLIPTKATALRRNQRPRASFSLAGFQVTLIGRFWVTAEERGSWSCTAAAAAPGMHWHSAKCGRLKSPTNICFYRLFSICRYRAAV
jgi:hypothetical protein